MKIYLVRHAERGQSPGSLSPTGREQAFLLRKKFEPLVAHKEVLVYSSNEGAAIKTAMAISTGQIPLLELEVRHDLFFSDDRTIMSDTLPRMLEFVSAQEKKADMIIIVSHREIVRDFPPYYLDMVFGTKMKRGELGYATGWVIDSVEGIVQRFE